jgi:hypothetical protein
MSIETSGATPKRRPIVSELTEALSRVKRGANIAFESDRASDCGQWGAGYRIRTGVPSGMSRQSCVTFLFGRRMQPCDGRPGMSCGSFVP